MIIQNIFTLITLLKVDFFPPLLSSVMSFQEFSNIQLFVSSLFFVGLCYVLNRIALLKMQVEKTSIFPGDSFSQPGSGGIIFLGHVLAIEGIDLAITALAHHRNNFFFIQVQDRMLCWNLDPVDGFSRRQFPAGQSCAHFVHRQQKISGINGFDQVIRGIEL